MSVFEFVLVLASILIGLAMAELFGGAIRIVRGELEPYWLHSVWVVTVLLGLVNCWWSLWGLNLVEEWTFLQLVLMLPPPIILFFASALLFPPSSEARPLSQHYWKHLRPFFVALALLPLSYSVLFGPVFGFYLIIEVLRILSLVELLILAFWAQPIVHVAVSLAILLGFIAFIANYASAPAA